MRIRDAGAELHAVELPLSYMALDALHTLTFWKIQEGTHAGDGHLFRAALVFDVQGAPQFKTIKLIAERELDPATMD